MRAIRDLPLAAPLLLVGFALFFGGAAQNGSLPWLGGGALLLVVVLLAVRGVPQGWPILLPFAALVAWLALSISWSTLPDRSWDYANRGLVYLLFAAVGLWLAGRRRELALGLAALLGAVAVWALLGKVLPFLYPDYERAARLRGPVGLWNRTRAPRGVRAAARALAPAHLGGAARVRLDRRARADLLARRARDGGRRRRGVVHPDRRARRRARRHSSPPSSPRPSSSASPSSSPA